jgi:nitroimidazol reductase NimA-like FMN-containing flavoprotein (pyridoxamine 5'-phosphate oxidase superfamily)
MDIEELSREECLRLLQYESYVGRVAFIAEGRPMILPVNYLADDKAVVFSTAPGDKLTNLREAAPVAFEVDAIRPLYNSGWDVVVQGTAMEILDPDELELLRRGPLKSWATSAAEHWIRITIEDISGRRLSET